ncbi:MAG: HAMP domain-containing protein [Alphaproteobacteria bacterium]|nr:MAG: HAMP domain-containing protein [Alphaproteobacteria bacterium]
MNAMSEIDTRNSLAGDEADVILGDNWDERAPSTSGDDSMPDDPRWFRLNRSGLARKIVTYNLIALVVLVAGILFVSPGRERLVEARLATLAREAGLVARVFEAAMPAFGPVDLVEGDGLRLREVAGGLDLAPGTVLFVFDQAGALALRQDGPALGGDGGGAPIGGAVARFADWVSGFFRTEDAGAQPDLAELARQAARQATPGSHLLQLPAGPKGAPVMAAAVPIARDGELLGAVVLASDNREIERLVREDRERVLQMFLIALAVSAALSLVLANTIASPLADLAQAAEIGRAANASGRRSTRIRIPDMTGRPDEIGQLSGALRGMVETLYSRIDANERFAADVAHEVKNPLASLRSAVGTLRRIDDPDKRQALLDVIEHDVRRLDRLVSDISAASRLDSELVREERAPFDMVKLLRNITDFHRAEAEKKGIDLLVDMPAGPIIYRGIESRLAQVFVNLITNAISFCGPGDAIEVILRERDGSLYVIVNDTGPGIPEEALGKIFERFYSHRPQDEFGNHSGLGLAISKQIVTAHGGVIIADNIRPTDADPESKPMGASFVVALPLV